MLAIGVDIGGTKCAVCLGKVTSDGAEVIYKCTPRETKAYSPEGMLAALAEDAMVCIKQAKEPVAGIGVSCGSPLDSRKGLILSPPSGDGWNRVEGKLASSAEELRFYVEKPSLGDRL